MSHMQDRRFSQGRIVGVTKPGHDNLGNCFHGKSGMRTETVAVGRGGLKRYVSVYVLGEVFVEILYVDLDIDTQTVHGIKDVMR